jgi:Flp pilus assembly protein TadD
VFRFVESQASILRFFPLVVLLSLTAGEALAAHPSGPDSLLARSRALEAQGQLDAAEELAESAIVADPTRASSYAALGEIYMRAGKTEFARFYFLKALDIDPDDARAKSDLAVADRADQTGPTADISSDKKP